MSGYEILKSIKGRNSVANLRKMMLYNPNLDLINVNVYRKKVKFCPFILKIMSGYEIMTSIKSRNSVSNLRKMTLYNPYVDLINNNVYTKFG